MYNSTPVQLYTQFPIASAVYNSTPVELYTQFPIPCATYNSKTFHLYTQLPVLYIRVHQYSCTHNSMYSMLFCKTTTLITAVPSHDMNQGSIITILLSIKMITTFYRLISLQLSKSQKSAQIYQKTLLQEPHTYWPLTAPQETLQCSEEHSTPSYQRPNKPSPYLPQYLYNTTLKKSCDVGTAYQYKCLNSLT